MTDRNWSKRNPKMDGSPLFDAIPLEGPCPIGCKDCWYNRDPAPYPILPHPESVKAKDGVVRVNSGGDSNIRRDINVGLTNRYPHRFFNTAIPKLDFPAPVVLTANPREEEAPIMPHRAPPGLMFIRLRVSPSNIVLLEPAILAWSNEEVPVVLTFMRYFERPVVNTGIFPEYYGHRYLKRVNHLHEWWCPNDAFKQDVFNRLSLLAPVRPEMVRTCGAIGFPGECKYCMNCYTYYWQALRRMGMETPR